MKPAARPRLILAVVAAVLSGMVAACLTVAPFPDIDAGLSCGSGDGGDGTPCDGAVDGPPSAVDGGPG